MRETILEIGRDLAVGQSIMGTCPECGVGKLSVTRYQDGLGYLCWRASCTLKPGAVTDRSGYDAPKALQVSPLFKPQRFEGATRFPAVGDYAWDLKYRVVGSDHDYQIRSWGAGMAVFRLFDINGRERGWQSRSQSKQVKSGKIMPGPLYGFYKGPTALPQLDGLWIVEDPLSAIRLAEADRAAITILGTRLDVAVLDELWDAYPDCRRIYVALDPGAEDAAREAVRLCRSERGLDAIQVPLPDDIHRLDQDTLMKLLEAYP